MNHNFLYSYKSKTTGAIYTVEPCEYYEGSREWDNAFKLIIDCRSYLEIDEVDDIDFTNKTIKEIKKELKEIKVATLDIRIYNNSQCSFSVGQIINLEDITAQVSKMRKEYSKNPREAIELDLTLHEVMLTQGDSYAISFEDGVTVDTLRSEIDTLEKDYCGEVYTVNKYIDGEYTDGVSGCYLDNEREGLEQMRDFFDVDIDDLEEYTPAEKILIV